MYDFRVEKSCNSVTRVREHADGGSMPGRIRTGLIYPEEYYDPQEFFCELRRVAPEITTEKTMEVVS